MEFKPCAIKTCQKYYSKLLAAAVITVKFETYSRRLQHMFAVKALLRSLKIHDAFAGAEEF